MDEQKVMAEFGKVYSLLNDTNTDLLKNTKMLKNVIAGFNHHIDIFNGNMEIFNSLSKDCQKHFKRQNIAIAAGLAGFTYLAVKIKKLEDKAKKE